MNDAFSPAEMAERVANAGTVRAKIPDGRLFALAVLAGAFIGLGGYFSLIAATGTNDLGWGLQRVLMGFTFALGLILVVVAGGALFTGDNLLVMSWVEGRLSTTRLLRMLAIVLIGNAVGAAGLAELIALSTPNDAVQRTIQFVALSKIETPFLVAFARGVLCNTLVCLAVWCTYSCHTTGEKILVVLWPIAAFVAAGFEHSVANFFFFPLAAGLGHLDTLGALENLTAVTLGNIVGGAGNVALVYWWIYRRGDTQI